MPYGSTSLTHLNTSNLYPLHPLLDMPNVTIAFDPLINTTLVSGCIVLQFEEYIPWSNPDNIISFETEDMFYSFMVLLFTPVFFLISCPANIINMIVFYKHGLKERINVCLFALSLADEVYMIINFLWYSDQFYLRFTTKEKLGAVLTFFTNGYLLGLHGYIWVSQVLSAIIACERCFCVLQPLRSQAILQTSTMTVIIILVHVVILGLVYFEMSRYIIHCAIDPLTGYQTPTVTSREFYFRHRELFDSIDVFVLGIGLPGLVMIVVISTTIITTAKLRQAAIWRAETSSHSGMSERDVALTKMLIINSVFFIICLIPFMVFRFIFLFDQEMYAGGRKHNFYFLAQEILIIFSYINCTFNIIVYYTMGSRYRQTFWQLFGKTTKNDKENKLAYRSK